MNAPGKRSEISVESTLYATFVCPNRYVRLPQPLRSFAPTGGAKWL